MASVAEGIDDIEVAKTVVEYDDPTDERQDNDGVATTTSDQATVTTVSPNRDATTLPNPVDTPGDVSAIENTGPEVNDDTEDNHGVKQIQMTVAADAPWKDRLWEGSFTIMFSFYIDTSFTFVFSTQFSLVSQTVYIMSYA